MKILGVSGVRVCATLALLSTYRVNDPLINSHSNFPLSQYLPHSLPIIIINMYRARSNAVSGFRASDIVDEVRKQMGLYTPPPLSAPKTPLRDSTPVNAMFAVPPVYATINRSPDWGVIDAEASTVPVQDASSTSEVHWQADSGEMEWMCEDTQSQSIATLEFDMEFDRDEDGEVIMKEPEYQV